MSRGEQERATEEEMGVTSSSGRNSMILKPKRQDVWCIALKEVGHHRDK